MDPPAVRVGLKQQNWLLIGWWCLIVKLTREVRATVTKVLAIDPRVGNFECLPKLYGSKHLTPKVRILSRLSPNAFYHVGPVSGPANMSCQYFTTVMLQVQTILIENIYRQHLACIHWKMKKLKKKKKTSESHFATSTSIINLSKNFYTWVFLYFTIHFTPISLSKNQKKNKKKRWLVLGFVIRKRWNWDWFRCLNLKIAIKLLNTKLCILLLEFIVISWKN